MSKKLVSLIFLLCFISFGESLELKSLCSERVSKDENYTLNSYYRLKLNVTLLPIKEFLDTGTNTKNKETYYAFINELYSEEFIGNLKSTKIQEKKNKINSLKEIQRRYNGYSDYMFPANTLPLAETLLDNLGNLTENYLMKSLIPADELSKTLTILEDANENQRSSFENKFLDIFYEKKLALLDGFKMNRSKKLYLDTQSDGTLFISLYLPFYDKNLVKNSKENCSCTDKLPQFFTVETNPITTEN